jgi:hypothetical protein
MTTLTVNKPHDIVQREFDKKWVVWANVDHPEADLDWHRKSGLPVPTLWVPIYVGQTEEEAKKASKSARGKYKNAG